MNHPGDDILPVLGFPGFLLFGIFMVVWHLTRSHAILEKWAQENGFMLLSLERRYLRRGSFFWSTSNGQMGMALR